MQLLRLEGLLLTFCLRSEGRSLLGLGCELNASCALFVHASDGVAITTTSTTKTARDPLCAEQEPSDQLKVGSSTVVEFRRRVSDRSQAPVHPEP